MNTLRNRARRVAGSALLVVALAIGAQAFVPTAFGCGQGTASGCVSTTVAPDSDWVSTLAYFVGVAETILP